MIDVILRGIWMVGCILRSANVNAPLHPQENLHGSFAFSEGSVPLDYASSGEPE